MDSVKKEKHRFNFVDAIIIIAVIAALALIGYIFLFGIGGNGGKAHKDEEVRICYAIECAEIREDIARKFKPGELFTVSGHKLGYGVESVVGDREYIGTTSEGKSVKTNIPGYNSVIFIIESDAVRKEYEYELDEYYKFQVGCGMRLSSRSISGSGYCIGLAEIKTDEDKQAFINKIKAMSYKADVPSEEADENE